jgi:hypothetical protein
MANDFMEQCSSLSAKALSSALALSELGAKVLNQTTQAHLNAFNNNVKQIQNLQCSVKSGDFSSAQSQLIKDCQQNYLNHIDELSKIASNSLTEAGQVFQTNLKEFTERLATASKICAAPMQNNQNTNKNNSK